MKKYLVNKDFIPISFIENQRKNERKGDKRGIIMLTIIALWFVPNSIGNLFPKEEKSELIKQDLSSQYRSLNKWLDFMDGNLEGEFSQESGTIIIEGQEKLSTLLDNENITIDTMEELGEKKYRLQISQK
ncbi:hypothetical protein [Clostridium vincentii]|uniref:Uncharacterized protein n=1 Tax=Clostridium vincentii TaxID=52704 RepID=A0A2T0BGF1_9CLOT|nr:hypothetical protein [Clostridium vincentii]PRR82949.1 hypothetical protein CLVI_13920 [Clostridium vincentii]